jgi:four helix bundle protein
LTEERIWIFGSQKEKQNMNNFRTLDLAKDFYRECQKLKLSGPAKNQFERALLSIPLNLTEGSAKPSAKERRKYYYSALGSLREIQTLLDLTGHSQLKASADHLGAMLYKLCKNT